MDSTRPDVPRVSGFETENATGDDCDPLTEVTAEDNDGRPLFEPKSRYEDSFRREQRLEGIYIAVLLVLALVGMIWAGSFLSLTGLGDSPQALRLMLLGLGGLLGGVIYGAKWLYHAIATGLWHQDRRMWRVLSPWISVGTTIGIAALVASGFFPQIGSSLAEGSPLAPIGIGFVIGYLSDQFLAKMREVTGVIFGEAERHFPALEGRKDRRRE